MSTGKVAPRVAPPADAGPLKLVILRRDVQLAGPLAGQTTHTPVAFMEPDVWEAFRVRVFAQTKDAYEPPVVTSTGFHLRRKDGLCVSEFEVYPLHETRSEDVAALT